MLNIRQQPREITNATEADLTDSLLTSNEPVVLRGLIASWPACKAAGTSNESLVSYLKSFENGKKVRVFSAPPEVKGRYFYNSALDGFNFNARPQLFTQLLDELLAFESSNPSESKYLGSTAINAIMPGFREHNELAPLASKPIVSIWIGNRSRIAAHYDVTDNVACNVAGKREFILFPPEQMENLYIGPIDFTPAGQPASLVDFHAPDFEAFPKFKTALEHALIAKLEPGDAIFIPSMWWHHVEGKSAFNVLVNYWWRQIGHHAGTPMDAMQHAILAIRDLPELQRLLWQKQFEKYVFNPQEQAHIPENARGILNKLDEQSARMLRATLLNKLNR